MTSYRADSWADRRLAVRNGFVCALLLLCGALLAGCNGSTDPAGGVGDVAISFLPADQGQEMTLAETIEFTVVAANADTAAVNWWRQGTIISNAMRYTYVPNRIGTDTLRVQASADGVERSYYWVIEVRSTGTTLPPAVPSVAAGPGPGPGEVAVTWNRVSVSTYPLDEYVIAVSFDGEITNANWDAAREVGRVAHRVGRIGYEAVLTPDEHGMIPGADAWFAVRAVDELGQMSPVEHNGFTMITTGWWLNGVVRDDTGAVVPGVVITALDPPIATNSELNGTFRLGPLRSIDKVVIETTSAQTNGDGWYDFRSGELDSISGRDYEVRLIKRHLMDVDCNQYEYQFLTYFRRMTLTWDDPLVEGSSRLWRWPTLPLGVYVPELVNGAGVDYGAALRFAMSTWNDVMGGEYFTEVASPAAAELVGRFDDSNTAVYGRVTLLAPFSYDLGDTIPEQMQVYLRDPAGSPIANAQYVRVVALHELGHTLGIYNHADCAESGYLMVGGVTAGQLDLPEPIHANEQQLVRCIFSLPQGADIGSYMIVK